MSAIPIIHIKQSYTRSSPMSVDAGVVSASAEASFKIKNLTSDPIWCRLNNTTLSTATDWARAVEAGSLSLSLAGARGQALTLEFYQPDGSVRYISMFDSSKGPVATPGRVEITRHGN